MVLGWLWVSCFSVASGASFIYGPPPKFEDSEYFTRVKYPKKVVIPRVGVFLPDFAQEIWYRYEAFVPAHLRARATAFSKKSRLLRSLRSRQDIYFDPVSLMLLDTGYYWGGGIYTEDFTCMEAPRVLARNRPEPERSQIDRDLTQAFGDWRALFWEAVQDRYVETRIHREYYAARVEAGLFYPQTDPAEDYEVSPFAQAYWTRHAPEMAAYRQALHTKWNAFLRQPVVGISDETFRERLQRFKGSIDTSQPCQPAAFILR